MSRKSAIKTIRFLPLIKGLKAYGWKSDSQSHIHLTLDEVEVIRLLDYLHLNQEEAAPLMNISRPTLTRIYENARKKIAKALIEGKSISISGGQIDFNENWFYCESCHQTQKELSDSIPEHCPHCLSLKLLSVNQCFNTKCYKCKKCEHYFEKETQMKIAVPIDQDLNLNSHFGQSEQFAFITVNEEKKEIISEEIYKTINKGHCALSEVLNEMDIELLIAGGIGAKAIEALTDCRIKVINGAPSIPYKNVIEMWFKNELSENITLCNHHDHHHHHHSDHDCSCHK